MKVHYRLGDILVSNKDPSLRAIVLNHDKGQVELLGLSQTVRLFAPDWLLQHTFHTLEEEEQRIRDRQFINLTP